MKNQTSLGGRGSFPCGGIFCGGKFTLGEFSLEEFPWGNSMGGDFRKGRGGDVRRGGRGFLWGRRGVFHGEGEFLYGFEGSSLGMSSFWRVGGSYPET